MARASVPNTPRGVKWARRWSICSCPCANSLYLGGISPRTKTPQKKKVAGVPENVLRESPHLESECNWRHALSVFCGPFGSTLFLPHADTKNLKQVIKSADSLWHVNFIHSDQLVTSSSFIAEIESPVAQGFSISDSSEADTW